MELLQVKKYHELIAEEKQRKAVEAWKESGYSYPLESGFFFMLEDGEGYPTTRRKKGWVAFGENWAVWGRNKEEAMRKAQKD